MADRFASWAGGLNRPYTRLVPIEIGIDLPEPTLALWVNEYCSAELLLQETPMVGHAGLMPLLVGLY